MRDVYCDCADDGWIGMTIASVRFQHLRISQPHNHRLQAPNTPAYVMHTLYCISDVGQVEHAYRNNWFKVEIIRVHTDPEQYDVKYPSQYVMRNVPRSKLRR